MRISHKHKFIFIAVPKTGTTSMEAKLDAVNAVEPISNSKHITLENLKAETDINLDSYFSFSFSRNPWDRHLSIFKYYKKMIKFWDKNPEKKQKWRTGYERYKNLVGSYESFNDFVKGRPEWAELQTHWLSKNIDFIGRMENIQSDFDIICDKTGMDRLKLDHLNKSNSVDYREIYNDESIDIVSKSYKKDIDYLGCKFEG